MLDKNRQPLVSVGIPTYNRPELLRRAIDSIVNQTYENLEVIISDNATAGNTVEDIVKNKPELIIPIQNYKFLNISLSPAYPSSCMFTGNLMV